MEENNNFMDKNTFLAIALSILFFVGWQYYVQKKYPQANKQAQAQKAKEASSQVPQAALASESSVLNPEQAVSSLPQRDEVKLRYENSELNIEITSRGMGFSQIELKQFTNRANEKIQFLMSDQKANFATFYKDKVVDFDLKRESEHVFLGTALIENTTLEKRMEFKPQLYTVDITLRVVGEKNGNLGPLTTVLSDQVLKVKSSFFMPSFEGTEFFVIDNGSEERVRIDTEAKFSQNFTAATLTSIGSQYFAVALVEQSELIPSADVKFDPSSSFAVAQVTHPQQSLQSHGIKITGFMGPKKYDLLRNLDPQFVQMINYGMFSVLSKPLLSLLQWLYSILNNWGLAIIALTIFVRLLLLPINISSMKSMKKMQKIQPQLKAIKEKYKDDPMRVNQETMALMKREKANPIGGCLPMLLQLPVFFALYSVLGQSVELYKSPFIFWITDLSYPDPFFVLPIAVGGLYFIQMNITPQPMDPAQAKVMKFIPIIFSFFMITVPSGLTLYFFVNTVFGIGQQLLFQREKKKATA